MKYLTVLTLLLFLSTPSFAQKTYRFKCNSGVIKEGNKNYSFKTFDFNLTEDEVKTAIDDAHNKYDSESLGPAPSSITRYSDIPNVIMENLCRTGLKKRQFILTMTREPPTKIEVTQIGSVKELGFRTSSVELMLLHLRRTDKLNTHYLDDTRKEKGSTNQSLSSGQQGLKSLGKDQ